MPIFSKQQMDDFNENGYIILNEAVPQQYLDEVVDATWEFLAMDRNDPKTWYDWPQWHLPRSGMVQLFHHQSMWNVRQYPRIHQAFAQLYGTEKLWVSLDRLNMNPPALPEDDWQGIIHWDEKPTIEVPPLQLGGVLNLTDTSDTQGGFQCVPGSHNRIAEILDSLPEGHFVQTPIVQPEEIKSFNSKAGDLIIWNTRLLHSNSRNRTDTPRVAQYINMTTAKPDDQDLRDFRVNVWRNNLTPYNQNDYGQDPRGIEKSRGTCAKLTDLGRKLLGDVAWD